MTALRTTEILLPTAWQARARARAHGFELPLVLVGALAGGWCVATLAFVLLHDRVGGLTFTGSYAGLFPGDQLRYLAWIREAGSHILIADPFRPGAPHVYLQPLFVVSGLLWRAGLSIQAAYLVWTPVALAVLIWGSARFVSSYLVNGERVIALALGLLFFSPLIPLFDWGGIVDANGANYLVIAGGHGAPYWQAWGYLPTAIALGLQPFFLLGLGSLLTSRVNRSRTAIWVTVAGVVIAWLHPWGGIEVALVVAALLVWRRHDPRRRVLVGVGVVSALPLIYYLALAHIDPAWSLSQLRATGTGPIWWPMLVAFLPLLLAALPALRRPHGPREQILVLWPAAALALYVVLGPGSRGGALEGVSLPLSVLAVRGWRQLRAPRLITAAALFLAIVPGAVYSAQTFHDIFRSQEVPFGLARGEQRAVDSLVGSQGNVLTTPYLAPALPALSGLLNGQVSAGSNAFFDGGASAGGVPLAISQQRPEAVVSDCLPGRADLAAVLERAGYEARAPGCAQVYQRPTTSPKPPR